MAQKKKDDDPKMFPLHVFLLKESITNYMQAMRLDVELPKRYAIELQDADFECDL